MINITQIEQNLQDVVKNFQAENFIFDLLLAYGSAKSTIKKLQLGSGNLSKIEGEVLLKKKVFFKRIAQNLDTDFDNLFENSKNHKPVVKNDVRFIILTDDETLLALDRKTGDELRIAILDIAKHFDFFLPLAGLEKAQVKYENPADVKAAERMGKIFDEIRKDNTTDTPEAIHTLNVFFTRLLFCFFAEDTGIFKQNQFTRAIESHTQPDGSDLHTYLDKLFEVMNTHDDLRKDLPQYLSDFPYVNGGLFAETYHAPIFSKTSRKTIIACGDEDWSLINPDIFGSMMQAVISAEYRGGMGMHYTSVPNIMKVIEPLFLDELQAALEDARGNLKKLNALRTRLANIKIFDPACGSGNFLIIAYKELRKLEMAIFKEIDHINKTYSAQFSDIRLSNFYGIELDDFAHELAILALWLAEHQMNQVFFKEFGRSKPPLPLLATGNIIQGNACRINWESVCPKLEDDEIYILGNPPYIGSRRQDDSQKNDLKLLFEKDYKSLDYIAAWFLKGANYIREINAKCAFVSTNSICQGEQVNLLWSRTLINNIEIGFAYSNFKWTNNAKGNAGVTVIIICLQNRNNREKYLYSKDNLRKTVKIINPYLTEANIVYIQTRQKTLSNFPEMNFGNMPADGGKLLFTTEEKREFVEKEPDAESYFRKLISAEEFLNGKERWCLWLDGYEDNEFVDFPLINQRIEDLKKIRAASSRPQLASIPHLFAQITQPKGRGFILIPRHSSENRDYIPISWFDEDNVAHDSCLIIPTDNFYLFSIFTSKMHMIWVNAVCGRLETRYRYSKDIVYNNFPFPPITTEQKATLENHVYNIIDERDRYSERTLAELYDPDKMPDGLREAHRMNDIAVEQCYRNRPFESDEERLEYLFKLYEKMIAEEQERGTLFASEKKKNKK